MDSGEVSADSNTHENANTNRLGLVTDAIVAKLKTENQKFHLKKV